MFFAWNLMMMAQRKRHPYVLQDLSPRSRLAVLLARSQSDVEEASTILELGVALDRMYEPAALLKEVCAKKALAAAQVRKTCNPET